MIWFILGIAPLVLIFLCMLFSEPVVTATIVAFASLVVGSLLLAAYGMYQLGWVINCGTFWESYSC